MKTVLSAIHTVWKRVEQHVLDRLAPVVDLVARLYLARVFFWSGWNKFQDWDSTLYLFREEYHVPLLPPDIAAVMGTGGELGLSVLLAIGLWTRFSACGLLVLNLVAVYSYYDSLKDSPAALQDHLEWGILLSLLAVSKVRQLTVDHLLIRRWLPSPMKS